ncbi:MAG: IPT/TIG domain-containing protein [Bryobacteraceae bacterium]|nr:IPT/TIG domain-containing protein [Bryobacteraceae bacterium]MDW8378963.1 IPT/TIG domain-containing protein [Bryobacterales bacterium]
MKPFIWMLIFLVFLSACFVFAQGMPKTTAVEPTNAKPGAELTVTGENLDAKVVKEIYLTDGQNDTKLVISSQTATSIKCRIPENMKTGRFSIMLMTAGPDPKLIEQPVRVTIE